MIDSPDLIGIRPAELMRHPRLRYALSLARVHPHPDLKTLHCAVVDLKNGQAIVGYNRPKSHPLQKRFGRTIHTIFLHAEIDAFVTAIRRGIDLEGATVHVARASKHGKQSNSLPCTGCLAACEHFGIERVYYTLP